jgi:hypothetical protein
MHPNWCVNVGRIGVLTGRKNTSVSETSRTLRGLVFGMLRTTRKQLNRLTVSLMSMSATLDISRKATGLIDTRRTVVKMAAAVTNAMTRDNHSSPASDSTRASAELLKC